MSSVGDYIFHEVTYANRFLIGFDAKTTVTSLVLDIGTWLTGADVGFECLGGNASEYHSDISLVLNAVDTAPAGGSANGEHNTFTPNQGQCRPTGNRVFVGVNNLTIYLNTLTKFTGSQTVYGYLWALRVK